MNEISACMLHIRSYVNTQCCIHYLSITVSKLGIFYVAAQSDTLNYLCFSGANCSNGFMTVTESVRDCCCLDGASSYVKEGSSDCGLCADYIDPDGPPVSQLLI